MRALEENLLKERDALLVEALQRLKKMLEDIDHPGDLVFIIQVVTNVS